MYIVDILNVYLISFISYTCVTICLTWQMIKNNNTGLDNSNDYFRLKNSQKTFYGFLLWGAYETSFITVYLCLYYNIQQQYISRRIFQ